MPKINEGDIMSEENKEYIDLIPVIVERESATMPEGFDSWGVKSVHPDLKTYLNFQWPTPGQVVACDENHVNRDNTSNCPSQIGDGLCVGTTWDGMASGGIPAITLLLVAYRKADVLGERPGKLRTTEVAVVAIVDGARLLREGGARADLRGADLREANLREAKLHGADLRGTKLRGTNLYGANLYGANLYGADLYGANLYGADLRGSNLREANLREADLYGADLRGVNLRQADLRGVDLYGANLRGADLRGALNKEHAHDLKIEGAS